MRVIFAGGGTGGHINPALSIANYVAAQDSDFKALFVGTTHGLETKLVPGAGYDIEYIDIAGFDRRNMLRNVVVLKKLVKAVHDCKKIIRNFKPDCVILTGGYVSGPMAMAAKACKIPALIHEQNVYPGLTVKGSLRYVDYVAVSFDETVPYVKDAAKCVVTGNPIRPELLCAKREPAREALGIYKPFILVFGGSLGAVNLNKNVLEILPRVFEKYDVKVLFGTGDKDYKNVMELAKSKHLDKYDRLEIVPYINNMHEVMAACDLAITRSGAITVCELSALGVPAVLIPFPYAVRNHQEQNARAVEDAGGAKVITERELTPDALFATVSDLLENKDNLTAMHNSQLSMAKTDALEKIYALMLKMVK